MEELVVTATGLDITIHKMTKQKPLTDVSPLDWVNLILLFLVGFLYWLLWILVLFQIQHMINKHRKYKEYISKRKRK